MLEDSCIELEIGTRDIKQNNINIFSIDLFDIYVYAII